MEVDEPVPGRGESIWLGKQSAEDKDKEGRCGGGRVTGEWTL